MKKMAKSISNSFTKLAKKMLFGSIGDIVWSEKENWR